MGMLKIAFAGALSYVGYKAWQRYQAAPTPTSLEDDSARTPPHGDALLTHEATDNAAATRAGAQSSPGFGGT